MKRYTAPWSTSLVVVSAIASVALGGAAIATALSSMSWITTLPVAIFSTAVVFMIRGYSVSSDALLVHRLFWATRLPLTGLDSAQVEPEAMRRSIRLFGNGGLFSFSGWFRNRELGTYRAFVTDPSRAVVLHFPKRTVVVSPSAPDEFVRALCANAETR
jgi:PH (Pleckstrin Homology) domain-containing protein